MERVSEVSDESRILKIPFHRNGGRQTAFLQPMKAYGSLPGNRYAGLAEVSSRDFSH
jgi:hypothetical protein